MLDSPAPTVYPSHSLTCSEECSSLEKDREVQHFTEKRGSFENLDGRKLALSSVGSQGHNIMLQVCAIENSIYLLGMRTLQRI